jgi:hypothetical protein
MIDDKCDKYSSVDLFVSNVIFVDNMISYILISN